MNRVRPIMPPEGIDDKIRAMLFGDHTQALRAKQSLVLKSTRLQESDPEQAAALRRIYRRIKL